MCVKLQQSVKNCSHFEENNKNYCEYQPIKIKIQ